MKLELGLVQINDIRFASKSKVENGTIYVDTEELGALLLEDENLKSVKFEIAEPEEGVRVMPVKDVIEPRVKVSEDGNLLPGVISKMETVGNGRTNVLKGSAIVTTGKIVGFQKGIIDMRGEGAKCTPFSQLNNLVVTCEPIDGLAGHAHKEAVRFAGLKAAGYIGKLTKDAEPDEVKIYETCSVKEGIGKHLELPKITCMLMLQNQGLMHGTYVYGVDMKQSLPTVLNPTELIDGAVSSGNCVSAYDRNTTYHHLSNPVVADLFKQHGKALNFVGVIITNGNIYLVDKVCSSDWTSKLCEFLGVDGAIVSQKGFGDPDTDLIIDCKKIKGKGIKTIVIAGEYARCNGISQSLADTDASANTVVTGGNTNMVINLPAMGKIIGYSEVTGIVTDGFDGSLRENGSIIAELQMITGATNEMGSNKLGTR